jgi:hypothetical protein
VTSYIGVFRRYGQAEREHSRLAAGADEWGSVTASGEGSALDVVLGAWRVLVRYPGCASRS